MIKDDLYMKQALLCAQKAIGLSSPNPRVGCVLVKDDVIIGQGYTQETGQAHAEIMAIRDAKSKGHDLSGCTVYVTLEPCSHFGRTPPCVEALIAIKPTRVVVALLDANPRVAGNGLSALVYVGIETKVLEEEHDLAKEAYYLNIGFMSRMLYQRVYTRLKWASSVDGKTALTDGRSQWITGEAARNDGHGFRARADVIVTGIGTVLHDNPQMNVRGVEIEHSPIKCIIDTFARTPIDAKLFDDGEPVWLVCADLNGDDGDYESQNERLNALREAHPQLVEIVMPKMQGGIDLEALWAYFYDKEINEVHVEAGAVLNASLLAEGVIDELLIYVAPRVVGAGKVVADFPDGIHLDDLKGEPSWCWLDANKFGEDLRIRLVKRLNQKTC